MGVSVYTMRVLSQVRAERERQDQKFGEQNHDPYKWVTIAAEELGEAAHDALEIDYAGYRKEMIEVAAVAICAVESIDRAFGTSPGPEVSFS